MSARAPLRGRRGLTLFVVLLALFSVNLTLTILTIAIEPISRDFGTSEAATAWITLAPIVVTALVTPAAGRAGDYYGRRRLWLFGMFTVVAGMALSGLAPTLGVLIAARVITGVGVGCVMPSGLALSAGAYPPEERGIAVGWWSGVAGFSPAVGVIVGGIIIEFVSWRIMFAAQLPIGIAAIVLGLIVFAENRGESTGRFDTPGAILGGVSVFAFMLAVNQGGDWGWTSAATIGLFVVSAATLAIFIRVEAHAENPVIPLDFFADRPIRWTIVTRGFLMGAYMGSFIILPLFLINAGGWAAGLAALALAPRPLSMSITGPIAGKLSTRLDPAKLNLLGACGICLAILGLVAVQASTAYWILLIVLIVKGVGLGLSAASTGAIATSRTPADELGSMSGTLSITNAVANSLGMAVMLGIVTSIGIANDSAYDIAFGFGAVIAFAGVLASGFLLRATQSERRDDTEALLAESEARHRAPGDARPGSPSDGTPTVA